MVEFGMPYLALDTSTEILSLALHTGSRLVARQWLVGQKHAELTLPRLRELLDDCGVALTDLQGIAFGNGPGSFTGLRIGCGIAQGLAFAHHIPLLGISTLQAMAHSSTGERIYTCLDARMHQVYYAAWQRDTHGWLVAIEPGVADPDAVPLPVGNDWLGVGSGFAAYGPALQTRLGAQLQAVNPDIAPQAEAILHLALPQFAAGEGVDAAQAELVYLRNKVALTTAERAKP